MQSLQLGAITQSMSMSYIRADLFVRVLLHIAGLSTVLKLHNSVFPSNPRQQPNTQGSCHYTHSSNCRNILTRDLAITYILLSTNNSNSCNTLTHESSYYKLIFSTDNSKCWNSIARNSCYYKYISFYTQQQLLEHFSSGFMPLQIHFFPQTTANVGTV